MGRNRLFSPSQNLETGCPKLATVKFWGVQFSRETIMYSDYIHFQVPAFTK